MKHEKQRKLTIQKETINNYKLKNKQHNKKQNTTNKTCNTNKTRQIHYKEQ